MKKAAIELSANFLVIIILAIAVLGFGIKLTTDAMRGASESQAQINAQTEREIYNLLDSGGLVVAPLNTASVQRGDLAVFGVGVRNIRDTAAFTVNVEAKNVNGCVAQKTWLRIANLTRVVPASEKNVFNIGVAVPKTAKSCTYVFKANVTDASGAQYGNIQLLYVTVK